MKLEWKIGMTLLCRLAAGMAWADEPAGELPCRETKKPPLLSTWPTLPASGWAQEPLNLSAGEGGSMKLWSAYDDQHLYIGVFMEGDAVMPLTTITYQRDDLGVTRDNGLAICLALGQLAPDHAEGSSAEYYSISVTPNGSVCDGRGFKIDPRNQNLRWNAEWGGKWEAHRWWVTVVFPKPQGASRLWASLRGPAMPWGREDRWISLKLIPAFSQPKTASELASLSEEDLEVLANQQSHDAEVQAKTKSAVRYHLAMLALEDQVLSITTEDLNARFTELENTYSPVLGKRDLELAAAYPTFAGVAQTFWKGKSRMEWLTAWQQTAEKTGKMMKEFRPHMEKSFVLSQLMADVEEPSRVVAAMRQRYGEKVFEDPMLTPSVGKSWDTVTTEQYQKMRLALFKRYTPAEEELWRRRLEKIKKSYPQE